MIPLGLSGLSTMISGLIQPLQLPLFAVTFLLLGYAHGAMWRTSIKKQTAVLLWLSTVTATGILTYTVLNTLRYA